MENFETIINEALATTIKPLTDLVPEIMAKNDDASHPPLEDPSAPKPSPKRPMAEKRTSVLGSVGKFFWSFGSSEKIATAIATDVTSDQQEVRV